METSTFSVMCSLSAEEGFNGRFHYTDFSSRGLSPRSAVARLEYEYHTCKMSLLVKTQFRLNISSGQSTLQSMLST